MNMLEDKKKKLAEQLRAKSITQISFPEDYLEFKNRETVEHRFIKTRHGETGVYIHTAKETVKPTPVFINIHGGGFVRPLIETNSNFCSRICAEIKGVVIDIDYKLSPEYQFPVALEESYDVVRWVFEHAAEFGSQERLIALGGHSAGANQTASITLMANQTKDFRLGLQILDFGCFDMATDPAEKTDTNGNILPFDRIRAFTTCYTDDDPETVRNPYVSQVFAPDGWFPGLPAALIITGGNDLFRVEGEDYGMRLVRNGVKVTMERFPDSPHGFTVNCNGKWREAQQLIIDTLRNFYFEEADAAGGV